MRIRAERKALIAALKRVKVENTTASLAVLNGVRFDAAGQTVGLTATNLDLTIAVDLACDVVTKGDAILPATLLERLLSASSGEVVEIDAGEDEATVSSEEKTATIRTLRVSDWPRISTAEEGVSIELGLNDVERLGRILHAVRTRTKDNEKENRPALYGVHFVDDRAECTDGYRLGIATLSAEGMPDVVVPVEVVRRVLAASPSGFTMTIGTTGARLVTFDSGDANTSWTTRTIVAEYPNIQSVIRKDSAYDLVVNTAALADAVAYVKVLADDDNTGVDLTRDGDKLLVTAAKQDVGDAAATVPCAGTWDVAPIRFNGRYLGDLLDNHDGDEVTFELEDALKPANARSADHRVLLMVMPVRRGS